MVLLLVYPVALLASLGAWMDGGAPAVSFFSTLLLGFAWPGAYLASRRLREPDDLDVVEADGRAPVLVLHAYERSRSPWWRRIFVPSSFLADLRDTRHERALRKSLSTVGPVLTLARPLPPPTHGPVVLAKDDGAWERELRTRMKSAALIAIVVDGTSENHRELDIVATGIDPRRIILITPAKIDAPFAERWTALREVLPGLPALDARVAAVRFDKARVPTLISAFSASAGARRNVLSSPSMIVKEREVRAWPKPPSISWVLTALPIGFALVSSVITGAWVKSSMSLGSDEVVVFGMGTIFSGVILAVMSRRVMRLVPGSELPMVAFAAFPWLLAEISRWVGSSRPYGQADAILAAGAGAAYSAPLLLATAFVLAGASLMRKSPERKPSYAIFGIAAVIPFATLATTLPSDDQVVTLLVGCFFCSIALALAAVAASGEPGRRHAPLSVGSGAAAGLALAALATAVTHRFWSMRPENMDASSVLGFYADRVGAFDVFDSLWAWFLLPIPLVAILIGGLFDGRANRGSAWNVLTILPFIVLLPMANVAHQRTRARYEERVARYGEGLFAPAAGAYLSDVTFVTANYGNTPEVPVDIVLDRSGAIAGGRRIASEVELSSFGATGGPHLSQAISSSLLAREYRDRVGIAADPNANGAALLATCRAAWAQGATFAELVMRTDDGRPTALQVAQAYLPVPGSPYERVMLYLEIDGRRARITATDGTSIEIGRTPDGALDYQTLRERLSERRQYEPNRRDMTVVVLGGASAGDVLQSLALLEGEGFSDLFLTDSSRL